MNHKQLSLWPAAAIAMFLAAPDGRAQSPQSDTQTLGEIIVTAQKRAENISDVGISITAFNGQQLENLGVDNTVDLAKMTPGLRIREGFGNQPSITTFTIRGVSSNDFTDHTEGPIAVYVDEAYNSFLGGIGFQMFDVDRVEVLRGPQGTLFGRNATGGVVHLISRRPTEKFEAYGEVEAGEYNLIEFEGALSGPISDSVRARLAVQRKEHDGWYRNSIGPDAYAADAWNARAQLEWDISDHVQLLLNARGGKDDTAGSVYTHVVTTFAADGTQVELPANGDNSATCSLVFGVPVPSGTFIGTDCGGYRDTDGDPHTGAWDFDPTFERESWGVTATLTAGSDALSFTSITDYYNIEKFLTEDSDASPNLLFVSASDQDARQFSQEFRMNGDAERWRWVAGLYYLDIDGDYSTGFSSPTFFFLDNFAFYSTGGESWAAFGQMDFDLTETWRLIAGLRYTEDDKELETTVTCEGPTCAFFGAPPVQVRPPQSRKDEDFAAKLQLNWHPSDDFLLYAGVTRGNKAGGFNVAPFSLLFGSQPSYQPEVLTSYEAGIKSTVAEGRVRLNTSVYYYDYKDYQAFQLSSLFFTNEIFNTDGEFYGIDADLHARFGAGWEILVGGAWVDATVKDVVFAPGDLRDVQPPDTPDFSGNAAVRKEWDAWGGKLSAQVAANYVGERNQGTLASSGIGILSDYTVVDVRLGYGSADGQWNLEAFVENVTDEEYRTVVFPSTATFGGSLVNFAPPRWAGVRFRYQWE